MAQELDILQMQDGKITTSPELCKKIKKQFDDLENTPVIDALTYLSQS